MEQKTTTTPPQWVEDMQKWQKENAEHRSVICVATDKYDTFAALGGYSLPLVISLLANTYKDENWAEVVKAAYLIKDNPLALRELIETWKEFKKEHGFPMEEEEESEKKTDLKSTIKDFLHTLADKL